MRMKSKSKRKKIQKLEEGSGALDGGYWPSAVRLVDVSVPKLSPASKSDSQKVKRKRPPLE